MIKNGVDVGSEFSSEYDGAFYFDMDPTADEAWDISYVPQRKLHFKTTGSPKNVAIYRLSDVTNGKNIAGINTIDSPLIDRIDLLNEGVTYRWQLLGPVGKNFKRVTIDGEEVQLTDGTNVSLPYITLGRFDVDVVIEFTEDFMVNAYATNDATVAIGGINSSGEIVNESSITGAHHKLIDAGNGVKITFLPAAGDVLRSIMWGQYGTQQFTVGDGYLTKETVNDKERYVLTLPADFVTPQMKPIDIFAVFDKPDSLKYDLNNDGTVNIADVTTLVNKVLRKE